MTEYCGMCANPPPEPIHYGVLCLLSTLSSVMSPMLLTFHPTRSNKERFASAAHQLSKDITSVMN